MNPRITDRRLLDHHDFARASGLPIEYFCRPSWFKRRCWWLLALFVAVVALLGLALTAGDLPNL